MTLFLPSHAALFGRKSLCSCELSFIQKIIHSKCVWTRSTSHLPRCHHPGPGHLSPRRMVQQLPDRSPCFRYCSRVCSPFSSKRAPLNISHIAAGLHPPCLPTTPWKTDALGAPAPRLPCQLLLPPAPTRRPPHQPPCCSSSRQACSYLCAFAFCARHFLRFRWSSLAPGSPRPCASFLTFCNL